MGVNVPLQMQMSVRARPTNTRSSVPTGTTRHGVFCVELYSPSYTVYKLSASMVKHFSVDWMAQSSTPSKRIDEHKDLTSPVIPHVRCMVQPRQPSSYGKDYLQPKPKSLKTAERADPNDDISLASPARSTSCVSPSKLIFWLISNQNISSRLLFICVYV